MSDLARHLAGLIRHDGPMRLDRFMALCNAHYYATRDPLGAKGDFITAPEISQLFGELIGLAMVDHWQRAGSPAAIRLVELGPGRGTLMADLLRAAALRPAFLDAARITLVETSPALRTRQAHALAGHDIDWADSLDEIPADSPLYLVANEFFDALPIRQFHHTGETWTERHIALSADDRLTYQDIPAQLSSPVLTGEVPGEAGGWGHGAVLELNEPTVRIAAEIGQRLTNRGGLALIVDYGYASGSGDTFQAMKAHAFTDPLETPGEADLTAHVDFTALAKAAATRSYGPISQGDFLTNLGLETRLGTLGKSRPDQAEALRTGANRLTDPHQMGSLFKALALTGPGGPAPAGFAS
jgi:NADH dehydrogenase [ubiquinone] 1 alpha subcomplex assembly factor 7